MFFNTSELDWKSGYKLMTSTVVPRPIAWVVTMNPDDSVNAAPYSLFNYFAGYPPVVCIAMSTRAHGPSDSLSNIRSRGEFVINMVPQQLAEAMNITAIEFPPGVSEIAEAGLQTAPSTTVSTPRIVGSPVALECRLVELKEVMGSTGFIVIAQVMGMHIADEAVLDASKCYIDTSRLNLVGRMESPGWYTQTNERFPMQTPTLDDWHARGKDSN